MDQVFVITLDTWRFGDALTQVAMVVAAVMGGFGLVFSSHLRHVAAVTLLGLLALRMFG